MRIPPLKPERFRHEKGICVRLTSEYLDQIEELYSHWRGNPFTEDQIHHGVLYGVTVQNRLRAIAGTHVASECYQVAAIGGVFTHPDDRGKGYGTATTGAVAAELIDRGVRDVVLSVGRDNAAAIRIYERLGFDRYSLFLAGFGQSNSE